jgi:hypothetical protein
MLRVALLGLLVTWGVSLTRLVVGWSIPASVPVDLRGRGVWPRGVRHARG